MLHFGSASQCIRRVKMVRDIFISQFSFHEHYSTKEFLDIIDSVLQLNGYFGHLEDLLLAMTSDERQSIRELSLRQILKARLEKSSTLRQFKIPKLNFDAGEY